MLPLVDHHCHGTVRRELDADGVAALLTEAGTPGPPGVDRFDSRIGLAVRRHCAPVLDLPADAPAGDYLARRAELGTAEVTRRFLGAVGLAGLCVDTGFEPEPLTTPEDLGAAAGAPAYRIVRLESVAERVAAGCTAAGFAAAFRAALEAEVTGAVGLKSIAAYRVGLDLPAAEPAPAEVTGAVGRWLGSGAGRLADPTLHAFLVWAGAETGLPIQFHVGYGDRDVDLHRCDPLLLTGLLRALGDPVPVMLLHNYPYHRQAGYLAQVFDSVYLDIGLAGHAVAGRTATLLAEATELAPLGKLLYSSDAYGLPELHHLAATVFRDALRALLSDWPAADADRLATLIASGTARRVYGLG